MTDTKNYISPQEFFLAVVESQKAGEMTPELVRLVYKFCDNVPMHRNWIRYVHLRQDIISECVTKCVETYSKFRPYKDPELANKQWEGEEYHWQTHNNPHAWFTSCCFNQLRTLVMKEYNQDNIKNRIKCDEGLDPTFGYDEVYKAEYNKSRKSEKKTKPSGFKKIKGLEF